MIDEGSARPPSREESSRGLVDRPEYGLFLFEVGVGEPVAGEEHVELVVVWVAESSCDWSLEFDQSVERHRERAIAALHRRRWVMGLEFGRAW